MEALGGFVEQEVAACQDDFMRVTMKILDDDRPRLCIIRRIDVQDKADDMCLRFINMHMQVGLVSVQTETVGTEWYQFHSCPRFRIMLQLIKDPLCQIRPVNEPWLKSLDDFNGRFKTGSSLDPILDAIPQGLHQVIRSPGQSEPVFREIGRYDGRLDGLQVAFVSLVAVLDFRHLTEAMLVQLPPPRSVGHVLLNRPGVVALVVFDHALRFRQRVSQERHNGQGHGHQQQLCNDHA
mmetsp:Transcript_22526/g.63832  ORF Transcript_22526/g.63832 Transcript_22526/m.63832 type:complete len:237 (+) Transcript_22526:584-1294(+)